MKVSEEPVELYGQYLQYVASTGNLAIGWPHELPIFILDFEERTSHIAVFV